MKITLYDSNQLTKYSVCMTCFNEAPTVRDSLDSILGQVNEDYEVVVVDNFSTDGTYEILHDLEQSHSIRVIQKRSSRGLGRQVAFENSFGEYILANLDLDDVFLPVLEKVVSMYHESAEGNLAVMFNSDSPHFGWVQNITIGSRELIASLGGWRDVNMYEDWDLWSRADRAHKYCWTFFKFAENETPRVEPKRRAMRLARRYEKYRDRLRLGMKIFDHGEKRGLSQRLAYTVARFSLLYHGVLVGQDPEFNPLSPHLFVDLVTGE